MFEDRNLVDPSSENLKHIISGCKNICALKRQ